MVVFSHEVGGSFAVLEKFSAVMGMPTMHMKTFQGHDKKVTGKCFLLQQERKKIQKFLLLLITDSFSFLGKQQ